MTALTGNLLILLYTFFFSLSLPFVAMFLSLSLSLYPFFSFISVACLSPHFTAKIIEGWREQEICARPGVRSISNWREGGTRRGKNYHEKRGEKRNIIKNRNKNTSSGSFLVRRVRMVGLSSFCLTYIRRACVTHSDSFHSLRCVTRAETARERSGL